jgi:hypothetical protein
MVKAPINSYLPRRLKTAIHDAWPGTAIIYGIPCRFKMAYWIRKALCKAAAIEIVQYVFLLFFR